MSGEQLTETVETEKPKRISRLRKSIKFFAVTLFVLLVVAIGTALTLTNLNKPTDNFPTNQRIVIDPGTTVRDIANLLADKSIVRSDLLLYYSLVTLHDSKDIKASSYIFEKPLTTLQVAQRLTEGDFDNDLIKIIHFEGERASLLADRVVGDLAEFDRDEFVTEAELEEGKLFPDTYLIPETYTNEQLLELLLNTFSQRIKPLEDQISAHPLSLEEILVLASIIEREANTLESKRMVSGILQNRLAIDMPLQADASVEYILGKPLNELTANDLEVDSPYNTYLNLGLPPTAIGNPGLEAIEAVLNPAESEYFFYITDDAGIFHYAKTYNQHLQNVNRYLR